MNAEMIVVRTGRGNKTHYSYPGVVETVCGKLGAWAAGDSEVTCSSCAKRA